MTGIEAPVLVVEDEADTRELVASLLEFEGLTVARAADGMEALAVLRSGVRPCVIVTDLMMPRMDGWELARRMKQDPEYADLPVILVSGVADLARRAHELSADAFLTKPVDVDQLLALVRKLC